MLDKLDRSANGSGLLDPVRNRIKQLIPSRENLYADAFAGLTETMLTVPDAIASGLLAGISPVHGLYGVLLATPVAAIFTSSVFMHVNITNAMALAAFDPLRRYSGEQQVQAVVVLTVLVGLFQILAGWLRFGRLVRFVSNSVMTGFLTGLAINIVLAQIKDITAYSSPISNRVLAAFSTFAHFNAWSYTSLVIGVLTLLLIVGLDRSRLNKVSLLLPLIIASVAVPLLGWDSVAIVGDTNEVARTLPRMVMPNLALIPDLLTGAIAIAIIGLVQGAGISRSYPNPDGRYPSVSGDFFGQGVANFAAGLFQGMPAGASLSGTAVLVGAGARTRWANVFAGIFILVTILLFASFVEMLPMPALAALLIVVGARIIKPADILTIMRTSKIASASMVVTLVLTLSIPLQFAVFSGVAISILLNVFEQSNKVKVVRWVPVDGGFPEEGPVPEKLPGHAVTVLQTYGSLSFSSALNIERALPDPEGATHAVVLILLRGSEELGSTFLAVVSRYNRNIQNNHGRLMLVGVGEALHRQLERTGLLESLGEENIFRTTPKIGEAFNIAYTDAESWLSQIEEQEPSPEKTSS